MTQQDTTYSSLWRQSLASSNKLTEQLRTDRDSIIAEKNATIAAMEIWKNTVEAKDINGVAKYIQVLDLTSSSVDYMYPIWWNMPGNSQGESRLCISRHFSDDSALEPFGAGIVHIAGLQLVLSGVGYPWGGDANYLNLKILQQRYRETVRQVRFGMHCYARKIDPTSSLPIYGGFTDGQIVSSSQWSGCYLRGGLTYRITKSFPAPIQFSIEPGEVAMSIARSAEWEIAWKVKPQIMTDNSILGATKVDVTVPYSDMYDVHNDARYAPKPAPTP